MLWPSEPQSSHVLNLSPCRSVEDHREQRYYTNDRAKLKISQLMTRTRENVSRTFCRGLHPIRSLNLLTSIERRWVFHYVDLPVKIYPKPAPFFYIFA